MGRLTDLSYVYIESGFVKAFGISSTPYTRCSFKRGTCACVPFPAPIHPDVDADRYNACY